MSKTYSRYTFVTRHYPPNPNINGESIWDLVKYLKDTHNIDSNIVCIDRDSAGGGHVRDEVGNVVRLKPLSRSENLFGRALNFLSDGYRLIKKAKQFKNTIIVCNTSPPLLPFWGGLMLRKKFAWSVWFFDLFPEFLYANKIFKRKNLFYRFTYKKTYQHKPDFIITLGPKQAENLQHKYQDNVEYLTLPCGVFFYQNKSDEKPDWYSEDKITIGYCGNIGMAHNPDLIKHVVNNLDTEKYQLVLALYGSHAKELKDFANGKAGVILVDSVPRNQLHFIDIHLVTLRSEWTHIAVPSKAVSAVSLGSTIIFCGDKGSDNWFLLQQAGWFIDEKQDMSGQIRTLLNKITKDEIAHKKQIAEQINIELKKNINRTYEQLSKKVS